MSKSTIDALPETKRRKVLDALLSGKSLRSVAQMVGVSHTVISDYKRRVMIPALKTAQQIREAQPLAENSGQQLRETATLTREIAKATPFMERHQFLWEKVTAGLEKAEKAVRVVRDTETGEMLSSGSDLAAMAPLLNQAHKNLELLGQVTGELQPQQALTQNIMIVSPAGTLPTQPAAPQEASGYEGVTIDIGPTRD